MTSRLWKVTILTALFVGQTVPARSDEQVSPGRNGVVRLPAPGPVTPVGPAVGTQPPFEQVVNYSPAALSPSANVVQPPVQRPSADGADPRLPTSTAQPAQLATPDSNGVVRLPAPVTPSGGLDTAAASPAAEQAVDGTWREDGRFVIININGKETKLLKPAMEMNQVTVTSQPLEAGTVRGRLLQGDHPLANCHVVMMPIKKEGRKTYAYDKSREPQTAVTDSDGIYFFEHAPAGQYKLTWLPEGTTQWIRRLVIKPDVTVRAGQDANVKDIRFAQSTIN